MRQRATPFAWLALLVSITSLLYSCSTWVQVRSTQDSIRALSPLPEPSKAYLYYYPRFPVTKWTVTPTTTVAARPPRIATATPFPVTLEQLPQVLVLVAEINEVRREAGLPALVIDARLSAAGQEHAEDMRDHNYFAHNAPPPGPTWSERIFRYYQDSAVGQVIAAGYSSPEGAVAAWMVSTQGHREIILELVNWYKWCTIGGGYASGGFFRDYYVINVGGC